MGWFFLTWLFADDVLLFARAYKKSAQTIKNVLHSFLMSSGLVINETETFVWAGNLRKAISNPLNKFEGHLKVSDVAQSIGAWSWKKISFELPSHIVNSITGSLVDVNSSLKDTLVWKFNTKGILDVKSAYKFLMGCFTKEPKMNLAWIWKIKCHSRIHFFLWSLMRNSLPMRATLSRRGISLPNSCLLYNGSDETIDHLFKNCIHTNQVWVSFKVTKFSIMMILICGLNLFLITRNKLQFEGKIFEAAQVARMALARASEFFNLQPRSKVAKQTITLSIKWNPPPKGWIKLNTDGSWDSTFKCMAADGVMRNHLGIWLMGFSSFLGSGNSIVVELCGVINGLRLARRANYSKLMVEIDSLVALNLIKDFAISNSRLLAPLIFKCRFLARDFQEIFFNHTHREGNSTADALARHGLNCKKDLTFFGRHHPLLR
ncbi:reverse transcriptase [Senna tora]|uniref:Reverse transcriptase n=1 Tax=Senna tora TaxID=362788 RepID=A0A834WT28_9FABA|nr:reverse transcriptase [Senna tora]